MQIYGKALAMIQDADDSEFGPNGGFKAVLSTPSEDRDFEEVKRAEWIEPLPAKCALDADHGMTVADTIGSFVPYFEDDTLMMKASFASTVKAQEVRTLITEGHIGTVSVAFMRHKDKKAANEPFRELLNAGVVAVPANRDAVILASKAASALKDAFSQAGEDESLEEVKTAVLETLSAEPYQADTKADEARPRGSYEQRLDAALKGLAIGAITLDEARELLEPELNTEGKKTAAIYVDVIPRLDEAAFKNVIADALKAAQTASGVGGDGALVQAIHDASSHLGAACPVIEVPVDPDSGASSGANKSVEDTETNLDAFTKALDEALPSDDSPAEAAAASDEEPAPADDAADDRTSKRARELQLMQMRSQL